MAEPESEPNATFELELFLPGRPLLPKDVKSLGLPETPPSLKVAVTQHETLNDLRITLNDSPEGYWLGAFRFRRPDSHTRKGELVNEWEELQEVFRHDAPHDRILQVSHEPYNETEVRLHIQRLRDLLSGTQSDPASVSVDAGATVHDAIVHANEWAHDAHMPAPPKPSWRGWPQDGTAQLLPALARYPRVLPKCVRGMALSAWNPPPKSWALRGHLLYLSIDTLEGDVLHITASVNGFFLNASSSQKFQPQPHPSKALHSSSLFDLLCAASPLFLQNFALLFNDPVSTRDYFSALPVMNSLPAAPWLAREPKHESDPMRTQTAFLLTGAMSADTLDGSRDWNEELQSSRELPRSSLAERLMRDRVLNRLYAEFTLAAARVVPRVAAGEVAPMNPADAPAAHMYLYNNLFVTRGTDSVDMYRFLGGDAAAHVAVGKDLQGVRRLGNLDIEGLSLLGTVVIDWLGERWVVQTVLPGLFRQVAADAAASQSDGSTASHVAYGGVEGPDTIHTDPAFHKVLSVAGKSLHVAEHKMRDAQGMEHELCLSVDCKGLRGTDGRMYLLDVSRHTPMDVTWLDHDMEGSVLEGTDTAAYPHRLPLLRPELIDAYWDMHLHEFARDKLARQRASNEASSPSTATSSQVDVSDFSLNFHPDAFAEFRTGSGDDARVIQPATDESIPSIAAVRKVSEYLRKEVIVRLISDVAAGLTSAVDGIALTNRMHARGINMRYLGYIANLSQPSQRDHWDQSVVSKLGSGHETLVQAFRRVVIHEMVVRSAKHCLRTYLRALPLMEAAACIAHFANCFLGTEREPSPVPKMPEVISASTASRSESHKPWMSLTPAKLVEELRIDIRKRFRFELPMFFLETELRKPQALRALCLKMGIQLAVRDYEFEPEAKHAEGQAAAPSSNATKAKTTTSSRSGLSKKGKRAFPPPPSKPLRTTTFVPEDVVCVCPLVKTSTPKSSLSEDAFEAGRISFVRGEREIGTELMLESIGFYEQVYGLVHPETGKCYSKFASFLHHYAAEFAIKAARKASADSNQGSSADGDRIGTNDTGSADGNKTEHDDQLPEVVKEVFTLENALRFQRQAVTVSERTLGLDHPETMTQYMNLAMMEQSSAKLDDALRYQERVMQLWQLLYGRDHPDVVHTLSSIALMLQMRQDYEPSLRAYEASHDLAVRLFGPNSIYTGNMAHELSQALILSGDLKAAIQVEKEAWRIFQERLGSEDPLTKESQALLSGLAATAVRAAKQQHARELVQTRMPSSARSTRSSAHHHHHRHLHQQQQNSASSPHPIPALANRSIDDLVEYIQGTPGTGTSRAARKRAARAKRS